MIFWWKKGSLHRNGRTAIPKSLLNIMNLDKEQITLNLLYRRDGESRIWCRDVQKHHLEDNNIGFFLEFGIHVSSV